MEFAAKFLLLGLWAGQVMKIMRVPAVLSAYIAGPRLHMSKFSSFASWRLAAALHAQTPQELVQRAISISSGLAILRERLLSTGSF